MLTGLLRRLGLGRAGSTVPDKPEGVAGVERLGHREYVGGLWDEVGQLQLDYLVAQGLRPEDCLLDIACGALRGGVHFVRYLDAGNYLGIDKEETLIARGIEQELTPGVRDEKRPEFVVSGRFEFERFSKKPQYSLAQSLFSHLQAEDIELCLGNLRRFVDPGHRCYVTFFVGPTAENPEDSHSHARFQYPEATMAGFGEGHGWRSRYLGDWGHPRGQMMMLFEAT